LAEDALAGPVVAAAAGTDTGVKVIRGASDDLAGIAAELPPIASVAARHPLDPAVIFYTSGTTGVPKGAVLTHFNLVMNSFTNAFLANDFRPDDTILCCLPLFHTFGQIVVMNSAFLLGARIVLQRRFDAAEALELIRDHGIEVMLGVPTMYMALLAAFDSEDPVTLRFGVCGGAPMPAAVLEEFERTFGCDLFEGYGLSETSPSATANQKVFGTQPGTIGHPLWGVEVEIAAADVDDRVELLEPGLKGEIVIRGHNIFSEYLDRPEETAAVMVDGWFRSGDIGTKDEGGFLRVVGRKKDMILRGGYNVYPREIEETLLRHPAVAQAAVVGIPHPTHGEEVLAVIVSDPSEPELTEDRMLDWGAEHIARHKRPRRVVFVDELPLGNSNKVLKRVLRDRYSDLGTTGD
jgi:long-chain acyl-CoA synthetase